MSDEQRHLKWRTARDETLVLWQNIRGMIDEPDEIELLTEINALCALCEVANAEEPKTLTCCERCLAYQQFGGCRGVNLKSTDVDEAIEEMVRAGAEVCESPEV